RVGSLVVVERAALVNLRLGTRHRPHRRRRRRAPGRRRRLPASTGGSGGSRRRRRLRHTIRRIRTLGDIVPFRRAVLLRTTADGRARMTDGAAGARAAHAFPGTYARAEDGECAPLTAPPGRAAAAAGPRCCER